MKTLKNIIIGILLGTANIIPGVSGGTLAMTMGIYEDLIKIASNIFKNFKKNILYLLPIAIGMLLAILFLSKLISYSLEKYEFQTVLFFIGLILGGVPYLLKKTKKKSINIKNILIMALSFGLVLSLGFLNGKENIVDLSSIDALLILKLFVVGVIAASTMVIPGISGSFILMLIGFYKPIIETISSLTNFDLLFHNLIVLGCFGVGVLFGIVLISKILCFLFEKFKDETYFAIYGIILASIIVIAMGISAVPGILGIIVGIILLVLGAYGASKLN